MGFLGLWGAGIAATWLKGQTIASGSMEHMEIDELLMRGLMSTGFLTWMSIPLEGAKGLARTLNGEVKFDTPVGDVQLVEEDRPGIADNFGMLGPTIGLGVGSLEALFGQGFDGQDLNASDKAYAARRMLPFGNTIYLNWLMRTTFGKIADVASGEEGEAPVAAPAPSYQPEDRYGETVEQMMGFSVGDTDPRRVSPRFDIQEPAPLPEGMSTEEVIALVMAKRASLKAAGKKGKKKRQVLRPLGEVMAER
jgi:hypothetical protein